METELATAWTGQVLQSPLLSGPSESATSCQQSQSQSLAQSTLPCCNVKVQMIYRCNCSPFCRLIWQMNCAKFSHYGKIQLSLTWHFGFIDLRCRRGGSKRRAWGNKWLSINTSSCGAVPVARTHRQRHRDTCVCPNCARLCQCLCEMGARVRDSCTLPTLLVFFPSFFVVFPLPSRPLLHSLLPWKWPCWCGRNQLTINLLIKHTKSSGNENEIATKNLKRNNKNTNYS